MTRPEPREGERLQKVLARAGVASRRAAEQLIDEGRVAVDGVVVREQGVRVDPQSQTIHVDGGRVPTAPDATYLLLNKPRGLVATMSDDQGRPCVGDLVADRSARLFHVGRLDADSEGLLLLTNDGELANRLMHPSYEVPKTYLAEVRGPLARGLGKRFREGVELEDGLVRVDSWRPVTAFGSQVMLEVVLHEGRKHVVRRLLAEVGHPVTRLVRSQLGPLRLGNLKAGRLRHLTQPEVGALYKAVGL